MSSSSIALVVVLACGLFPIRTSAESPGDGGTKLTVFDPKAEGYTSCRIPGLAITPRGTLLAWCEARRGKGGDWDQIDILLRRSRDGGRTWAAAQRLAGGGSGAETCNNPIAIVDRDGTVHFLYC